MCFCKIVKIAIISFSFLSWKNFQSLIKIFHKICGWTFRMAVSCLSLSWYLTHSWFFWLFLHYLYFYYKEYITLHKIFNNLFKTGQLLLALLKLFMNIIISIPSTEYLILFNTYIKENMPAIFDCIIYLSYSSWSNFLIKFVKIKSFLVDFPNWTDMHDANYYLDFDWCSLWF